MPQNSPLNALENREEFIARHLGPSSDDLPAMLAAIGAPSMEALIAQTVRGIADIRASSDGKEGVQSFLQKRKPSWVAG